MQFFAPMRDEPLGYASQCYWMKGTVLGEACEGPVFFDHLYFQHGIEWKEYRWYKDIQISWNVFGNRYDDGSVEFGHIVRGRQGWSVGAIVQNEEVRSMCTDVRGDFTVDEDGYVVTADYDCGDAGVWTFDADPTQQMGGFNEARWGGYRAQGGQTRRKNDDRTVVNGWTWLECFSDRMRSEGLCGTSRHAAPMSTARAPDYQVDIRVGRRPRRSGTGHRSQRRSRPIRPDGHWIAGELSVADPELCRWIASGGPVPGGASVRAAVASSALPAIADR